MWNQRTILVAVAQVRPESGDDYEVRDLLLYWPHADEWFSIALDTDAAPKGWPDCSDLDLPDVGTPNFNDASGSGVLEWLITARPGNVPGALAVAYWLAGNDDLSAPDEVVDYTLNAASDMQAAELRVDHWTDEFVAPIVRVRVRWLPSKLAELA